MRLRTPFVRDEFILQVSVPAVALCETPQGGLVKAGIFYQRAVMKAIKSGSIAAAACLLGQRVGYAYWLL
jgi:hypothetical protein